MCRGKRKQQLKCDDSESDDPSYCESENALTEDDKCHHRKKRQKTISTKEQFHDNFHWIREFMKLGVLKIGQRLKVEYSFSKRCSTEFDFTLLQDAKFCSDGGIIVQNMSMTEFISAVLGDMYSHHPVMMAVKSMGGRVPNPKCRHSFVSECKFAFFSGFQGEVPPRVFWFSMDTLKNAYFSKDTNNLWSLFESGMLKAMCIAHCSEGNVIGESPAMLSDDSEKEEYDDDDDEITTIIEESPPDCSSTATEEDGVSSIPFEEYEASTDDHYEDIFNTNSLGVFAKALICVTEDDTLFSYP